MTPAQLEVIAIAAVTALACALPGVFLVLRRSAMMSDAISHSILPGIVIAFFLTGSLHSPWLLTGAALTGVATVSLVELVRATGLVKEDAAIGLVFPALFSLGVILVSRFAGNVHLDTDAVLLGELAFAPFDRLALAGHDVGPKALWTMGGVLLLALGFIAALFKELKLATFDPRLAAALGFPPGRIHYALMALVSLTAVAAFDAVGSVLVVALMVAPAATAYLLSDRLGRMLAIAGGVAVADAVAGYWVAHALDASIAGAMAAIAGLVFAVVWAIAPKRGLLAVARRRAEQKREFGVTMLLIHLFNHEGLPESAEESRIDHLHHHLRWEPAFTRRVVGRALRDGLATRDNGALALTSPGRERARERLQAA